MSRISKVDAWLVDIEVERPRTDAVQAFEKQETIFVEIETADGLRGIGYSYTIGFGGHAVLAMLHEHLLPQLKGVDSRNVESIWRMLSESTRATSIGAITSLALAAIDIAIWDVRCRRSDLALWRLAGGYRREVPVYDTDGGWLHLSSEELVTGAKAARDAGWAGIKLKVGKRQVAEDVERVRSVREAVGSDIEIMVDANQSLTYADAVRRAAALEELDVAWFEEPLPADNIAGHSRLARSTTIPLAVGESLYSVGQFGSYLAAEAAEIIQVDAARVGGITPWLKVAHLAEACHAKIAPHFLMELHVSLVGAVPNGLYVEHIPQLRAVTTREIEINGGQAIAPDEPGIGISWDYDAIDNRRVA